MEGKDGKYDAAAAGTPQPAAAPAEGAYPGQGVPQADAPAEGAYAYTGQGVPQAGAPAEGAQQPGQAAPQPAAAPADSARWGTRQMGPPAAPGAHPENQKAAQWTAARGDQELPPYVIMGEAPGRQQQQQPRRGGEKGDSPMEHILEYFNTWSRKAEELATNIWFNLKTAPSMSNAAMGKLSLGAKALTEGGFDKLYKQTFSSGADEHVKKTFACYLSTATGPVAGTLYLTNMNVAFCSDRPLSFTAPSGQTAWSYYKVMIPLNKIAMVEPVTMKQNPPEKYVHIVTVDSHDFWFMGFVSYDKAVHNLGQAVSHRDGAATVAAHQ